MCQISLARAAEEVDLAGLDGSAAAPPRSCRRASAPRRVRAVLGHARHQAALVEVEFRSSMRASLGSDASPTALLDAEAVEQASSRRQRSADPDLEVEEDLGARARARARARAAVPISRDLPPALADQDPLLGLGLGPDLGADLDQAVLALARSPSTATSTACGISSRVRLQDLLADQLGEQQLARLVAAVLGRVEVAGPRGSARPAARPARSSPSPVRALIGKTSSTPSSSAASASTGDQLVRRRAGRSC